MKKYVIRVVSVCLTFAFCLAASASTATFQIISDPVSQTFANFALSGDGSVMAANYGGDVYRWTASSGFEYVGSGDPFNSSIGISRDGSTIISAHIGADGFSSPTIWNSRGMVDLGHPSNGCTRVGNSWGSGYGLNANGKIAVGLAWNCRGAEGFAWTSATGNVSLGHPFGNHSSRASGISANGNTIVGFWEDPTGPRRPVRWLGGKHDLFLGSKVLGEATAVSSNGKQIVGQSYDDRNNGIAFLYSDAGGMVSLGTIRQARTEQSFPNGISDKGAVIGWSGDMFGHGIDAFYWTPATGMTKLAKELRSMGAKIPAGFTLYTAVSISADGSTIVGQYFDSQFNVGNWIVHITQQ